MKIQWKNWGYASGVSKKLFFFYVGKTMSFLPAMIVNGEHSNYKNGDDWGMVYC